MVSGVDIYCYIRRFQEKQDSDDFVFIFLGDLSFRKKMESAMEMNDGFRRSIL